MDFAPSTPGDITPSPNPAAARRRRSVFVSYSSKDRWAVARLAGFLRAAGLKVFFDVDTIRAGSEWEKEILAHLLAAGRMFVFWSVSAASSDWVRREYRLADQEGIPVIPVALDTTPMPPELSKFQGLPELAKLLQSLQLPPGTDEALHQSLKAEEGKRAKNSLQPKVVVATRHEPEDARPPPRYKPRLLALASLAIIIMLIALGAAAWGYLRWAPPDSWRYVASVIGVGGFIWFAWRMLKRRKRSIDPRDLVKSLTERRVSRFPIEDSLYADVGTEVLKMILRDPIPTSKS